MYEEYKILVEEVPEGERQCAECGTALDKMDSCFDFELLGESYFFCGACAVEEIRSIAKDAERLAREDCKVRSKMLGNKDVERCIIDCTNYAELLKEDFNEGWTVDDEMYDLAIEKRCEELVKDAIAEGFIRAEDEVLWWQLSDGIWNGFYETGSDCELFAQVHKKRGKW